MRASRMERAVNYMVLVLFAAQALIPVLYVVVLSLRSERIGDDSWGHVENYATAWEQGRFSQYMANSAIIAVLVVGLALVLSLMSGYVLGVLRPRGGKRPVLRVPPGHYGAQRGHCAANVLRHARPGADRHGLGGGPAPDRSVAGIRQLLDRRQIGRASCRERV